MNAPINYRLKILGCLLACATALPCFTQNGIRVLNSDAYYPEGPIWYHDKLYRLGFDEASGNFQQTNFSGSGLGQPSPHPPTVDLRPQCSITKPPQ